MIGSTYRGLYRLDTDSMPTHIQVTSPGGHSIVLPIDLYESRGVLPNWRGLPTQKQYQALVAVNRSKESGTAFVN